ncbi:MAG: hypothetical protein ACK6A4_12530, partial [Alphaproteobacteria bacterium]
MSAPPKTELSASPDEERSIRAAVRTAPIDGLGPARRIARREDAEAVVDLLADPAVSAAIYDLPQRINRTTITEWIEAAEQDRQAGRGLLILTGNPGQQVTGYSRITVWPERSSAELAGALRAGAQGSGAGGAGAMMCLSVPRQGRSGPMPTPVMPWNSGSAGPEDSTGPWQSRL